MSGSLGEGLEGLALRRRSTAATVNRQPSVREEARGLGTVGSLGALQTVVRSTDFSLRRLSAGEVAAHVWACVFPFLGCHCKGDKLFLPF